MCLHDKSLLKDNLLFGILAPYQWAVDTADEVRGSRLQMLSELRGWLDACDVANPQPSTVIRYWVIGGLKILHLAPFVLVCSLLHCSFAEKS